MTDPTSCARCGQTHVKCSGHRRDGQPCGQPPMTGQRVCRKHGGKASQNLAAAERRSQEARAAADVVLFAARRDVHPAEALLELVQWTAGEVDYWRARVAALAEDDLTWGVTRVKDGGEDRGTTSEAKPNVAYVMLVDASKRLEAHCVAALRAGVEERRVRLAESYGAQLATVIRAILDDLGLSEGQRVLVGEVVPRHLRALGSGEEVGS